MTTIATSGRLRLAPLTNSINWNLSFDSISIQCFVSQQPACYQSSFTSKYGTLCRRCGLSPRTLQPNNNITLSKVSNFSNDSSIRPDRTLVNVDQAPSDFDSSSAVVYPNFISPEEGQSFIKEVSKRMKRRRFEQGHWDSVISLYREVELSTRDDFDIPNDDEISSANEELFISAIRRVRDHIAMNHIISVDGCQSSEEEVNQINHVKWLPCHAIDYHADGKLEAHVDSVKFSGGIVAGLSLLSDSIMRLKPSTVEWEEEDKVGNNKVKDWTRRSKGSAGETVNENKGHVDLYLPQLSLYVLSGMSRYSYTHELLPPHSQFTFSNQDFHLGENLRSINVPRTRRVSVIFRDACP
mmetsp:Transcript_28813/g.59834  ORF Transcript_28813/g.59834 Transcript_28813/m.59834 type:complete len:354 (-) Transcript_28813:65-1126(-)